MSGKGMGEKQREAMHKKVFEKGYIPTSLHFTKCGARTTI